MDERDTIEVATEDTIDLGPPENPPTSSKPCQLIPPCKQGNHGLQSQMRSAPDKKPSYRKIGKYYFTEEALKHDLAALKRGKVYTKKEFYQRARAWYKAEIDRILHWYRVYKERNPEKCEPVEKRQLDPERVGDAMTKVEEPSGKQEKLAQDSEKTEERIGDEEIQNMEIAVQDPKPIIRPKKVKAPVAPTRVQPPRAAKRKAQPPAPRPRPTSKKKKKKIEDVVEDTVEAVAPPPTPEAGIPAQVDETTVPPVDKSVELEVKSEQPTLQGQNPSPLSQPPPNQSRLKFEDQNIAQIGARNEPQQEPREETKADYTLNLDEWNIFLTRYNSATTPVTPTPDPASLSAFTARQLQGLDIANFMIRLERIVEAKINDLFSERQGITIDAAAGGGLCLTGYYHHPYKCALDGNYVPPPRFEAAGGHVPGEDWRPENTSETKEGGNHAGSPQTMDGEEHEQGNKNFGSTTGVVSSPRYRPPGSGKRLPTERLLPSSRSSNLLEAALHRQVLASSDSEHNNHNSSDEDDTGARNQLLPEPQIKPRQVPPNLPQIPALPSPAAQGVGYISGSTSMRNSPAPEAPMEISPTLGRWQPPGTALPLENFDGAILDVAGLRFAVDLCAGYMGDGRSARIFML